MEREWTPGEWVAANDGREVHDRPTRFDGSGARIGETPCRICEVESGPHQAANANLIAAALDLYEALDALMPVLRMAQERVGDVVPAEAAIVYGTLMAAAETALSKARGEATT